MSNVMLVPIGSGSSSVWLKVPVLSAFMMFVWLLYLIIMLAFGDVVPVMWMSLSVIEFNINGRVPIDSIFLFANTRFVRLGSVVSSSSV